MSKSLQYASFVRKERQNSTIALAMLLFLKYSRPDLTQKWAPKVAYFESRFTVIDFTRFNKTHRQILSCLYIKRNNLTCTTKDNELISSKNRFRNISYVKTGGIQSMQIKKVISSFFDNTPYGLLLENRMNNAYLLLESTHCQVSVPADRVVCSHASNFSAAFVKHFGISPKVRQKH